MTGTPDVSVVIPTRNRLAMLEQTLATVLGQQGVAVEAIVVDEGSSDATPGWLASKAADDPRVRVIRHDVPVRLPGARNAGLRRATAPLVSFVDDDDLWSISKLRLQVEALRAASADWSYAGCVNVDAGLLPVAIQRAPDPVALREQLTRNNPVPGGGSNVLVSREAIAAIGGFDETLTAAEDWDCWLRLSAAGAKPAAVDVPLIGYRRLAGSMSHEIDRMISALQHFSDLHPEVPRDPVLGVPDGTVRNLARLARENGQWREAAKLIWGDRANRGTLLRAPLYLAAPPSLMKKSFFARRSQVRWAQPLVDEIAIYR